MPNPRKARERQCNVQQQWHTEPGWWVLDTSGPHSATAALICTVVGIPILPLLRDILCPRMSAARTTLQQKHTEANTGRTVAMQIGPWRSHTLLLFSCQKGRKYS